MAPCERNPGCKVKNCPEGGKAVRTKHNISDVKQVRTREKPDSAYNARPTWAFNMCDANGKWAFTKDRLENEFWHKILPRLQALESQTWNDILVTGRKQNHSISIGRLNKCARDRLKELKVTDDEIVSLRVDGTKRIYGLRYIDKMVILWYDDGHGDNETCVCKSTLKHT